jgi:peroxiredoxin
MPLFILAAIPIAALAGPDVAAANESSDARRIPLEFRARWDGFIQHSVGSIVVLGADKPAQIKSEPAYRSQTMYGRFRLGNEAGELYVLAIEERPDGTGRIYLDANRNGDLTDDGDGAWDRAQQVAVGDEKVWWYEKRLPLQGTWRDSRGAVFSHLIPIQLSRNERYTLRENNAPWMVVNSEALWVGQIDDLHGRERILAVTEMAEPINPPDGPDIPLLARRYPLLMIDLNGDGRFLHDADPARSEIFPSNAVFPVEGTAYTAAIAADRSAVTLWPSQATVSKPAAAQPLLPVGMQAPDFEAQAWGRGPVKLSGLRGQIVVLDFWATWCNPCKALMPEYEALYQRTKDQGVTVLAVCVQDTLAHYEKWLKSRSYTFQFAFDTGQDSQSAHDLYRADSLPTAYVIGRDGKILGAFRGSAHEALLKTLQEAGVKL